MRCTRRDCVLMDGAIGQVRCRGTWPTGCNQRADCKQCRSFYRDRLMRWRVPMIIAVAAATARSEERRVGKEGRWRWWREQYKNKNRMWSMPKTQTIH